MPLPNVAKWIRTGLLGALLVLQPVTNALGPVALGSAALTVLAPSDADAKSRSSGGYSRPSASSSFSAPRTPSVGSPSSGGYARPSAAPSTAAPSSSAGDRAMSRQSSGGALNSYRQQQNDQRTPSAAPSSSGSPSSSSGFGYTLPPARQSYYGGWGWSPSPYMYAAPRSFGVWDAMFMWFMLDTLTRPSHAAFFHDNQNDPGYQQWRAEADRQAKDNAELRAKLDQLDQQLAAQKGQPREPGKIPADVPADVVKAEVPSSSSGGIGWFGWIAIIVGIGVLFWLWRARRKLDAPPQASSSASPIPSKEESSVPLFGTLGNFVDRKLSGKPYNPSLFRVGMTVTLDPTPFLLAGDAVKVKAPAGSGLVSVDGVGTVTAGRASVHRLHLGEDRFLQLHLDAAGQPDECRYFQVIDEVTPADAEEWGFWLDESEGMIGWSEFQTKDGQLYPRLWSPGLTRIEPFEMNEQLATVAGTRTVKSHAMLYARSLGTQPPAPQTEYILVSAIERDGEAWVQVAAGIDINPASLSLA